MAQLKSTNITGNLAVTGNILASKIIKLGGTTHEVLLADGTIANISTTAQTVAPNAVTTTSDRTYLVQKNGNQLVVNVPWIEGTTGALTEIAVSTGGGLIGGGAIDTNGGSVTISHADTSSVNDLTASNRTYVKSLTFDTYGHVTGYTTGSETVTDSNTTYTFTSGNNGFTVTPSGGTAKTVGVTATKIYREDTRSDNPAPYATGYANSGYLSLHLKYNTTLGITNQSTYSALVEVYPWADSSGGSAHQLAFGTNGAILHRYGTSEWSAWKQLATTSDIGNGTLTMATSGTGISGSTTFTANQNSASTFTVALNSSTAGNRAANQVVLATEAGQINSAKYAITIETAVKATWQYNSTTDCIELVWA